MGREIRRVPPNWEHPRYTEETASRSRDIGEYMPMHDENFDEAFSKWLSEFDRIRAGNLTDSEKEYYPAGLSDWLTDELPPDPKYYRHYKDEEATWFQGYETVSEGTPFTPAFETPEELIEYLCTEGSLFRDQYPDIFPILTQQQAENFVKAGSAVSMVVTDGVVKQGIQCA